MLLRVFCFIAMFNPVIPMSHAFRRVPGISRANSVYPIMLTAGRQKHCITSFRAWTGGRRVVDNHLEGKLWNPK